MFKVSILTIACRPGYIDSITQALRGQTLNKDEWEWVLVDDLYEWRKDAVREYIADSFNFKHIPPRKLTEYSSTAQAMNTAALNAGGELLHFMADYMYLHPRTLERHWEIYSKYGPKVLISGPLLDAITASGQSVWLGAPPRIITIKDDDGKVVNLPEHTPPISWPLKDNFEELNPDNMISVFKEPFKPSWPSILLPDWRLGAISNVSVSHNLCENNDGGKWFWLGRNDSMPLDGFLAANGMDESFDGRRGGADADLGTTLVSKHGYRYLVDREVPCYMLPHPTRKRGIISEEGRNKLVQEKRAAQPIPNDYSLREEWRKLHAGHK